MKWITREHVKVDRVACAWLIKKFVDPAAEFIFVQRDDVQTVGREKGATAFDIDGTELGHHGKKCSFEAILEKHGLWRDPALVLLARIVNGADTDNSLYHQPESAGLKAVAEGFRHLALGDDNAIVAAESIVYDALYAYCLGMVKAGRPLGEARA
ncbi:MAG: chromate resistance protein [Planctomycetes bacterium]|nr:chromate resistance protein [Planctomycetota bacterium]